MDVLCTVVAVLRILPNRSQLFQYDSMALSCEGRKNLSDWRIMRNTSTQKNEACPSAWGKGNESHCFLADVYQLDSGAYWCESGPGACSGVVNVTVTGGLVILESPVLPVPEGESVVLRCTSQDPPSFNLTEFYKDGLLVGRSSTGVMTVHHVSKSHEGLYRCKIPGSGESPESWLSVRGGQPRALRSSVVSILLPVVGACLSLASVLLLLLLLLKRNRKAEADGDVSYTDVAFPREELPKEATETTTGTFYSTIRPGAV